MSEEYECAISGQVEDAGLEEDADGLDDLPVGWTKITFHRRAWNPKWQTIQAVKEAGVETMLQSIPEEYREEQRGAVEVQVEASLYGIESSTPKYLVEETTLYVSDNEEVAETLKEIKTLLGIESDEDDDL